ncbi:unnamed protein product [Allacma fusca]|uniref:SEC14-like protein 2 n=1 Tax=Allacma fusca TaxID=39272 RepID=A0A8J2P643_9HEXA|nr:unnamed protein product [Allacma fusca]
MDSNKVAFSNKERQALDKFRDNVSDIIGKFDSFDAHDVNLIRWIRAREFNLTKAEDMLRKAIQWREENDMDNIMAVKMPQYLLDELPFIVAGHDKQGSIICIIPLGQWDIKKVLEDGYRDTAMQYQLQLLERGFRYMKSRSTNKKLHTQFIVIFDFDKFSVSQVMSKQAVGFMMDSLRIFEARYPETMKAAYAVNAPKIFELLWTCLKPLLTQHTLSKCSIYGGNAEQWKKALLQNIDFKDLPSRFGGTNTTHPYFAPAHDVGLDWPPRARTFKEDEFETVVVNAGEKYIRSFNLRFGNRISWNFKTDMYDIGFQCFLDGQPLYSYAKTDAHKCTQEGLIDAAEPGTYTLVFDNGYSRCRSKTLHYAIMVEKSAPDFTTVYFQKLDRWT